MTPESAGSNCANGGTRIDVGVDDNSNGVLEASEIDQTQYVCDGGSSNNTMLTSISSPPASMGCDAGGRVIAHGLDNGDGGGTYANGVLETGEVDSSTTFCSRLVSNDDDLRMVKAVATNTNIISSSSIDYLTAVGTTLYFVANDGTNGIELWKSDGTSSGTVMVKDIRSGSSSSSPVALVRVGTTLYFVANDGTNGVELWKSDGTASGTVMVKDINSGSSSSNPQLLTAVGNTLYFQANDGPNGIELWKSDGTASGTVMVKNIRNGSSSSSPNHLTAVGTTLYFVANDGTNGAELWKSDGTSSGTVIVKDINSGSNNSSPDHLTAVGNIVYFSAVDGDGVSDGLSDGSGGYWDVNSSGDEIWKSDGTGAGTVMVKDINSGEDWSQPHQLTAVGNALYFVATDYFNGFQVYTNQAIHTDVTYS
jgi:ELWxxDGT repeat protein